jgi:hypothetical protein
MEVDAFFQYVYFKYNPHTRPLVANPRPAGRMRPALKIFPAREIHHTFTKYIYFIIIIIIII